MQKLALAAVAATVVGMMATTVPAQAQPTNVGGFSYDAGLGCVDNRNCDTPNYVNWSGGWEAPDTTYVNWSNDAPGRYYNRWDNDPGYGNGMMPGVGIPSGIVGAFVAAEDLAVPADDMRYVNQFSIDDHIARCQANYRSYDPQTDQFLGYDGQYRDCRL